MLPGLDGIEVCNQIKQEKSTPIFMLSAKGEESNRIQAFKVGADDYVVKPFCPLKTMDDVQSALKELFTETLQSMLEAELDTELGYEKHEAKRKTTTNSRNGKSKKTVTSEYGDLEIAVPRDRNGEFEPIIVKKHQSTVIGIEDQIIAMYAKAGNGSERAVEPPTASLPPLSFFATLLSIVRNEDGSPLAVPRPRGTAFCAAADQPLRKVRGVMPTAREKTRVK